MGEFVIIWAKTEAFVAEVLNKLRVQARCCMSLTPEGYTNL